MTALMPVVGHGQALDYLAALRDAQSREVVAAAAARRGWPQVEYLNGGVAVATLFIASTTPPKFLLVDLEGCDEPLVEIEALAQVCSADTKVIALGTINDIALYHGLTALGVGDYLLKPLRAESLDAAIDHVLAEVASRQATQVIALIGARGGVGTSSLALSLAHTLSRSQKVVLIDLDLHFGTHALALDRRVREAGSANAFRDLLDNPERVDALLVEAALHRIDDRLALLGGEIALESDWVAAPDGLTALLASLGEKVDAVVIDLPRDLTPASRLVLRTADSVGIVCDLSLAGLRDTQRLLTLVSGLRAGARPKVIANRLGGASTVLPLGEFERMIGAACDFTIVEDSKSAALAQQRAQPLAAIDLNPRLQQQLHQMAAGLSGTTPQAKADRLAFWRKWRWA